MRKWEGVKAQERTGTGFSKKWWNKSCSTRRLSSSCHSQQQAVSPGKGLRETQKWGGCLGPPNSPPAFLHPGLHFPFSPFPLNLGARGVHALLITSSSSGRGKACWCTEPAFSLWPRNSIEISLRRFGVWESWHDLVFSTQIQQ